MMSDKQKHLAIIVGPYQSGKDTFIYNLDKSSKEKIDSINSKKNPLPAILIPYRNDAFSGDFDSYILNTQGWGNPGGLKDNDIFGAIVDWCIKKEFKFVNYFIFMQSISEPFLVEKILETFNIIFGEDVFNSSILIGTKGNLMDSDDLDYRKGQLEHLAKKYKIKGDFHEFKGKYLYKNKNEELIEKNSESSEEQIEKNLLMLGNKLKLLPEFSLISFADRFEKQTSEIFQKIRKESRKKVQVGTEKQKIKKKKCCLDCFLLCPVEIDVDVPIYEVQTTKTNEEIRNEAIEFILKKKKKAHLR